MSDQSVATSGESKVELTDEELRRVAGGDQKTEPRSRSTIKSGWNVKSNFKAA
jgi:hypothetical protein